jgi:hypothetical protein
LDEFFSPSPIDLSVKELCVGISIFQKNYGSALPLSCPVNC